ncbi:carboxypeptidase-like regulatory domain-containing protein [Myxococcus eversor]|uniref:carboxypeptidase-like regulatory domain-containing protein n=1 Tax=Myxococcus eversor TaxID=2709661 RepID=UPI003B8369AA
MNAVIPRLLCGLLALLTSQALAQGGTILGTVIDAQAWVPVPEVVITLTSPNLQGERTVVTNAQGEYRIPQLPPGVYTLRFEKEPFRPYVRTDVQLRLNRTIRVNVELRPASLGEVMPPPAAASCEACMAAGVNVDQEFIKRIAIRPPREDDATRSAPREEKTVTKEPSVKRAPPQYNFSPAMPGMSMTLRLHPIPSEEASRNPRRGPLQSRARFLRPALPKTSVSRVASTVKRPHVTCARTASTRSLR